MRKPTLNTLIGICISGFLVGCTSYAVSLNNKVVYTPPPLYKDFTLVDAQLSRCIQQTIADKHITKAEDLKELNCSNAGISSLNGIETFYAIEQLNLAENALQSIAPLSNFGQLKVLILRKNNLTNAEPLLHMLALKELDLADNAKLACGDLKQLITNQGDIKLHLPEQCK